MHFQQLLLLESYTKLLHLLSNSAAASNVQDISIDVNRMKIGLLGYLAIASQPSTPKHEMTSGPSSPIPSHSSSPHPPPSSTPQQSSPPPLSSSSPQLLSHFSSNHSSRPASPQPGSNPASLLIYTRPSSLPSSPAPPTLDEDDEPTPTASCSETDEISVITPAPSVISADLTIEEDPTVISGDPTVVSGLIVPEICVTPPPRSPSPPAPLPRNGAEATDLLVDLLEGEDWGEVWRIWKECRHLLLEEMQDLQLDDDQVSEILNIYCKSIAQTKKGKKYKFYHKKVCLS